MTTTRRDFLKASASISGMAAGVTVAAAILESGAVTPLECSGDYPSSSLRGRIDTKQGRRRDDSPEPIPLARGRSVG